MRKRRCRWDHMRRFAVGFRGSSANEENATVGWRFRRFASRTLSSPLGVHALNPKTQRSPWVAIDADHQNALEDLLELQWEVRQDGVNAWLVRGPSGNLPPGLAKKDRLPPGLERHSEPRGTLPPGSRARIYAVPVDLERELPPPPPNSEDVFIGGHVVLLNRSTFVVVEVPSGVLVSPAVPESSSSRQVNARLDG
jgi:hypothetical protein